MEIIIDTRRHCIETGSKKKYESLLKQYFKAACSEKETHILEHNIQALVYFLENADFSDLRSRCHTIDPAGSSATLVIPDTVRDMYIHLRDKTLHPVWKIK